MNKATIFRVAAGLVLLCLLFPPVVWVRSHEPFVATSDGFAFIGSMASRQEIKIGQWIVQFAAIVTAALFLGQAKT